LLFYGGTATFSFVSSHLRHVAAGRVKREKGGKGRTERRFRIVAGCAALKKQGAEVCDRGHITYLVGSLLLSSEG
jgi:hypothetical protein